MTPASAPAAEIFVLSDDPVVTGLTKEIMVRRGYGVQTYGREDIPWLVDQFRRPSPRQRLLIAKAMNGAGVSAAKDCHNLDPELKVVVTTASWLQWKERLGLEYPAFHVVLLGVPFRPGVLLDAVNRVLGTPRQGTPVPSSSSPAMPTNPGESWMTTLPKEVFQGFLLDLVHPFYMKHLFYFEKKEIDAFLVLRSRISDETIAILLRSGDWRCPIVGAFFAMLLNRAAHVNEIGRVLLKHHDSYSEGDALCLALAYFGTDQAADSLDSYLSIHHGETDIPRECYRAAMALRFLDERNATNRLARHMAIKPALERGLEDGWVAANLAVVAKIQSAFADQL